MAVAILVAACGDAADPPEPTTPPSTVAPTTTAPAALVPSPPPSPERYRYTARIDATVTGPVTAQRFSTDKTGAFVAPDAHVVESVTTLDGAVQPTERVTLIGDDAWYDDGGDGLPLALPAGDRRVRAVVAELTSASGNLLPDPDLVDALTAGTGAADDLGGVAAVRFTADIAALEASTPGREFLASSIGAAEDLAFNMWARASDGAVVRVVLDVAGPAAVLGPSAAAGIPEASDVAFTITVDITDIDDPGIDIQPPADFVPRAELVTFVDPEGRFTIEYPPDWMPEEGLPAQLDGGRQLAFRLYSPFGETATYSIVVTDLEPGTTLDQFGAATRDEVDADADLLIANARLVDFPAGTADALELERRGGTGPGREVRVLLVDGDRGYTLAFAGSDPEFGQLVEAVGSILASFTLLP